MNTLLTNDFVVGRQKLVPGNMVRIDTRNSHGYIIRSVVGTVKSAGEHDGFFKVTLEDALDDFTYDSRAKTGHTVTFRWRTGVDALAYFLDKDSDRVSCTFKHVIRNATEASLKLLATSIKQEHERNIRDWDKEIAKLRKEIATYQGYNREERKYIKKFERAYRV